jgi:hypothetical protein
MIKNYIISILKENWDDYKKDLCPKDRRMNILLEKGVEGMSTENIRFLFNEIVNKYAHNGVYLEVGMYRGCSLLSAALFNESTRCIGIDNFSQFDKERKNQELLKNNLSKFNNPENIEWYNKDYKEAIKDIFSKEPDLIVDVYFYDGNHSYRDQFDGLKIMLPYLADRCIIIVDDFNWEEVENANANFIKENPFFKSLLKINTEVNGSKDWHNGIEIIGRGF